MGEQGSGQAVVNCTAATSVGDVCDRGGVDASTLIGVRKSGREGKARPR
jgi:hypothetical protein